MIPRLSPLRYPGGKSRLSPFLASVITGNGLLGARYVEPYAGGAGAALFLLLERYVEHITINDVDPRIHAFWKAVTLHTQAFLELLDATPVSVRQWKIQREIYLKGDRRRTVVLGFATFYLNRTTRSGIVRNGGPIGGHSQSGEYRIDARFNKDELRDRVLRIARLSDRITVSCLDGLQLLRRIERRKATASRTFVYLDPPYYHQGASLYLDRFDHKQHAKLAKYLSVKRRFPWVMTYDHVAQIKALYEESPQSRFVLPYSAAESRKGVELLVHSRDLFLPQDAKKRLLSVA